MSIARAIIVGFVCLVLGFACGSLGSTSQSEPAVLGKDPDAEADRILTNAESQRRAILKAAEADRDRIVRETEAAKEQLAAIRQEIAQTRAGSQQSEGAKGPAIEPGTWGFKPLDSVGNLATVSWQMEFSNRTSEEREFFPRGSLVDGEGFEVTAIVGAKTVIAPFATVNLTGTTVVSANLVGSIVGVKAQPVPR